MFLPDLSFRPRLIESLRDYDRKRFFSDLGAGVTVGIIALPLAMAFAIASGVKPEAGIFTAIIAGFLISALGGSRVQIGGPAGAFIVVIYAIIERYGLANLLIATVLAGMLLFAMGVFRIGGLIRFIPVGIVIGFTNGIAVLIAVSQIRDFLGLQIDRLPGDFFSQMRVIGGALHTFSWPALALGLSSLLLIVLWGRWTRRLSHYRRMRWLPFIPGSIAALVLGTAAVALAGVPVETIGTRFGGIPRELPPFALPELNWELAKQLFAPTITIALLGAIESLLCARVADSMTDDRHDPNQELMAQGVANIVVPFFGGIPATGTIARTVTNIRSGASSPVAGMVHAATLLLIVLVAAPLAVHVPLATLAAILLFVAWNMGEWHEFRRLRNLTNAYRIVMVGTFLLTVIFDLTVAVEVGLVLACLFFIYRISALTHLERLTLPESMQAWGQRVEAWHLYGSLFFGAVSKIEALFDPRDASRVVPAVMILEMRQLISLDTTGIDALDGLRRTLARRGATLLLCELNEQPASLLQRSGFAAALGGENMCGDLGSAYARAQDLLRQLDETRSSPPEQPAGASTGKD